MSKIKAVLFDMDGVLYDSMPRHATSWMEMCKQTGLKADYNEFFGYEGRTGASTINLLIQRQFGRRATEAEQKDFYAIKSKIFASQGPAPIMEGAKEAVQAVLDAGALPVLVTGSGQASLLAKLEVDFPGAFPADRRVTAHDVVHGKPDPEPYLKGLEKAGVTVNEAIAVDNAPLGVQSAHRAGVYTLGVLTGPLPEGCLSESGANRELKSMHECAEVLKTLLA